MTGPSAGTDRAFMPSAQQAFDYFQSSRDRLFSIDYMSQGGAQWMSSHRARHSLLWRLPCVASSSSPPCWA